VDGFAIEVGVGGLGLVAAGAGAKGFFLAPAVDALAAEALLLNLLLKLASAIARRADLLSVLLEGTDLTTQSWSLGKRCCGQNCALHFCWEWISINSDSCKGMKRETYITANGCKENFATFAFGTNGGGLGLS